MYLFTDDCLTGIAQIDEEHRMLFQMMGQTKEHLEQDGAPLEVTRELMHALENYANSHFAHEEAYMEISKALMTCLHFSPNGFTAISSAVIL